MWYMSTCNNALDIIERMRKQYESRAKAEPTISKVREDLSKVKGKTHNKAMVKELAKIKQVLVSYTSKTVSELGSTLRTKGVFYKPKGHDKLLVGVSVNKKGVESYKEYEVHNVSYAESNVTVKVKTLAGKMLSYVFKAGNSSTITSNGTTVTIKDLGKYTAVLEDAFEYTDHDKSKTLGSNGKGVVNLSNRDKVEDYSHGDVGTIHKTLDEINELGGGKNSVEEMDFMHKVIGQMDPEFFNKVSLYLDKEAKESKGWFIESKSGEGTIVVDIANKKRKEGNQQTEAEVYLEEVLHAMTKFALDSKDPKALNVKRELRHTMKQALTNTSWENLLPGDKEDASPVEVVMAKKLYNYIFAGKDSEAEFLAKVIAVPQLRKHMSTIQLRDSKETLWEKVMGLLGTISDVILGNYKFKDRNSNVHEEVLELATRFGAINSYVNQKKLQERSIFEVAVDNLNDFEGSIAPLIGKGIDKIKPELGSLGKYPINGSYLERANWYKNSMIAVLTDSRYSSGFGLMFSTFKIKPGGFVREVASRMVEATDAMKASEWLQLGAEAIDRERMTDIEGVKAVIRDFFGKKGVTEVEEEAITKVLLSTNMTHLYGAKGYDNKEFRELLSNREVLVKEIGRAKHKLKELDKDNYNFNTGQATSLGYYMATGKGHEALNISAIEIAKGVHSKHRRKANKEVVVALDKVISLTALLYTKEDQKIIAESVMVDRFVGIRKVVDLYEAFKEDSKELFKSSEGHMITGYIKELFDEDITMDIQPTANREALEKQGYIWIKEVEGHEGDYRGKKLSLYKGDSVVTNERFRGATRLNNMNSKGTRIRDLKYKEGSLNARQQASRAKIKVDEVQSKIIKSMEKGVFDPEKVKYGRIPLVDAQGITTDYRYVMDSASKEKFFDQDFKISEVLPKSYASVREKLDTEVQNKKVLSFIKDHMDENWVSGLIGVDGTTEYTLIGPTSTGKSLELYKMLPKVFKGFIEGRSDKTMAIPTELVSILFGNRHLSLINAWGLKNITSHQLKHVIKLIENFWIDLVRIYKGNILLKMPIVLIANIVSNFAYMALVDPTNIFSMYLDSLRDVKGYMKLHQEVATLRISINADTAALESNTNKTTIRNRIIKNTQMVSLKVAQMEANSVHELYEAGMYQAIVEDFNTEEEKKDSNLVTKKVDSILDKAPKLVKVGLKSLYLTKDTAWYKFNQQVLQYSDLIARDVQNKKAKKVAEKQGNGVMKLPEWWLEDKGDNYPSKKVLKGVELNSFKAREKKVRMYNLLSTYINYSKPSSATEEYLNRIGVLMFTKYTKSIQRIILTTGSKHPIKTLASILGQNFVLDYSDINDQSFLIKDTIVPIYSPLDSFMGVITPPAINFID